MRNDGCACDRAVVTSFPVRLRAFADERIVGQQRTAANESGRDAFFQSTDFARIEGGVPERDFGHAAIEIQRVAADIWRRADLHSVVVLRHRASFGDTGIFNGINVNLLSRAIVDARQMIPLACAQRAGRFDRVLQGASDITKYWISVGGQITQPCDA